MQVGQWLEECSVLGNHSCLTAAVQCVDTTISILVVCVTCFSNCASVAGRQFSNALLKKELKVAFSKDLNVLHTVVLLWRCVCATH